MFLNFECLEAHLRNENEALALSIIYRPPGYAGTNFKEELEAFLMHAESTNTRNLYVTDFNIWMDDQENRETQRFTEILDNYSIRNYVEICTHKLRLILDLLLTNETSNFIGPVKVEPVSTISDHRIIWFKIELGRKITATKYAKFRILNSLNYEAFNKKIADVKKIEYRILPTRKCWIEVY